MKVSHEGLVQTGVKRYAVRKDGRRCIGRRVRRTIRMNMRWNLMPGTWKRHGFTLDDIEMVLKSTDCRDLWRFALMLDIPAHSSSIKPAFSSHAAISFTNNAIVRGKILNAVKDQYGPFRVGPSRLRDGIPVHEIPAVTYEQLKALIPKKVSYLGVPNAYRRIHKWRAAHWVPIREDCESIEMKRVHTPTVYKTAVDYCPEKKFELPITLVVARRTFYCSSETCVFVKESS